ncbi:MAG: TAXI family TRAP transporter solute-binding subunit [Vicinamibacteria bacterium]|nr:TAXI family TRAP transporter solute-binding subunit [Vicinamibacteria bacterium]
MRTFARAALTLLAGVAACTPSDSTRPKVVRLSIATGGTGGVYYVYGGALARLISEAVPGVEATAEVTSASIDNLKFLRDAKADIAFSLADTLKDASEGHGAFEGRPIDLRALAVLYTNVTHVVTKKNSGITLLMDLKGKVVSMGSAGSGTEVIADRTLTAAGLDPAQDIRRENLSAQASADALKDGKVDAFFWSGGLPTAAVLDLAISAQIRILQTASVLPKLQARYGESLYRPVLIPAGTYASVDADVLTFGVSNVLVVPATFDEQRAYLIVKAMFDQKAVLASAHAEARNLGLQSAIAGSPVAFSAGALKYYREQGVEPAPAARP